MPVFRLQTLGELGLARDDGEPVALRRKPLALLACLARRAPRPVPRAELATLLWGDRSDDRARQSLRQALLELKQAVGDAVEVTPESARVADGAVSLDLADFERAARDGRDQEAAELWVGEFFPNATEVGGEELERWVEGERLAAARRLGTVMERLVGAAELRADWDAASAWAGRWAAASPFDERAHVRLVEILRMRGRAEEALERHADFATRLRAELDVEPSPEFLRLAGGLKEQARTEAARRSRPSTGVRAPALVGRQHEVAELAAAWRSATAGTPSVVLVDDEGGGGKTRLADEISRIAGETKGGAVVLRASGVAADEAVEYATARRLLAALADAPGSAGASPESLAECARLVPPLAAMFQHLPPPSGDEAALRDAFVQLLAAVSEEAPVLLLLDDAHLADAASRRLVAAVGRLVQGSVALVLFADATVHGEALEAILAYPRLVRVRLRPLGVGEVEAMLASMINVAEDDRARLAARIHAETEGVPLLVCEVVTALVDERLLALSPGGEWRVSPTLEGRPLPLPAATRERLGARVARLSSPARTLLETAAVLGTPIDSVLLEAVAGLPPDEAAVGLRELSARHVVREEPSASQVSLVHPMLGRVAYALLPPSERQARHARAAAELAARDLTTTAERSVLPFHLARAGTMRASRDQSDAPPPDETVARRRKHRALAALGATAVVVVAAVASLTTWALSRRDDGDAAAASDTHRVMVAAFENRSGRTELDRLGDVAVDWTVRGLDETGLVEIIASPGGAEARGGATMLAMADRLESARAAHVGTIVTGTIDQRGDTVVLEAMLVNAGDGSLRRALPPVHAPASDPLAGVDRLRHEVVGAMAALVDPQFDPEDDVRSPPSYEAYVALIRGEEALMAGATGRAIAEYRKAAAADTTYALPLLRLAFTSMDAGGCARVDSITAVLERRRMRLSPFEGHYMDRVRALCRADWEAANAAARSMADLAPRSQRAQFAAALSASSVNRPREALRRLERMDPARGWIPPEGRYWIVLAFTLHMAGDDDALRALPRRMQGAERAYFTVAGAAWAAAALGRTAEVERLASELVTIGRRQEAGRLTFLVPILDELRTHGDRAETVAIASRLAAQVGAGVTADVATDTARYVLGELLYRAERWREARAIADSLVPRHAGNTHVLSLAGRSAARLGDRDAARRALDALERLSDPARKGADTYAQAQIAAVLGERAEAVRLLQRGVARGLSHVPDLGTIHLGHADIDLVGVIGDPAVRLLLQPRD